MTNIIKAQSLWAVVQPLVLVMAEADLSWSNREKVAAAIRACHTHWDSMEKERQMANQQGTGGYPPQNPQQSLNNRYVAAQQTGEIG
jgi:hypothetical protein